MFIFLCHVKKNVIAQKKENISHKMKGTTKVANPPNVFNHLKQKHKNIFQYFVASLSQKWCYWSTMSPQKGNKVIQWVNGMWIIIIELLTMWGEKSECMKVSATLCSLRGGQFKSWGRVEHRPGCCRQDGANQWTAREPMREFHR